jgi:hypothetical protein
VTTLDDLLSYEDDAPPEPTRSRGTRRWWWLIRAVLVAAGAAAVAELILGAAGLSVPYPLLFLVLFVVQVLRRVLSWVAAPPLPRTLLRPASQPRAAETGGGSSDGLYLATARWDTRLGWVKLQGDPHQFARTVQPQLVQIIDERLRLRHGVVRAADPARARALLGERLWTFASTPVGKDLSPRDLAALIGLMEAL